METPEGPACGLIKAFSLAARVTHAPDAEAVRIYRIGVIEAIRCNQGAGPDEAPVGPYVFMNGDIVGSTTNSLGVAAAVRALPPPGTTPHAAPSVYVCPCDQSVYVRTDEARVVRPLLMVPPSMTLGDGWKRPKGDDSVDHLLATGALRYVDAAEVAVLDLALEPAETRTRPIDLLEVHAHLMLGVTAALIPLLQANQSPRNAYQTSMGHSGYDVQNTHRPLAPASCWRCASTCGTV